MKPTEPKPLLSQAIEQWRDEMAAIRSDINRVTHGKAFSERLNCLEGLLSSGIIALHSIHKDVTKWEIECDDQKRGESLPFRSRGVGLDICPGCFVCGAEKRNPEANVYLHNIAAFTDSQQSYLTMMPWFSGRIRCDFREDTPDRIQVKVGACDEHLPHLNYLHRQTSIHGVIRDVDVQEARGYLELVQPKPKPKATPAELYEHMSEVAKANGFDSLTEAIAAGVQWREAQASVDQPDQA